MYTSFFRLNEVPFSIAPDPRFLFMSERHCEAMAHLLFGVQGEGGIVLLTGEVGTGKTTVCRRLIEQMPENVDVAFIVNPRMSAVELLQTICEEFHVVIPHERPGVKTLIDALNARLLATYAQDRRSILIVDEAQNLDADVLEQLRLLTNLETSSRKLLQIFLIGQPELQATLNRPEMRQVSQRIIARYHLTELGRHEVNNYVAHRLRVAGGSPLIFPESLSKQIHSASGGIPRLINLICERALLGAYVLGHQQVSRPILRQAIKEVLAKSPRQNQTLAIAAGLAVLAAGIVILLIARFVDANFSWTRPSAENVAAIPIGTPTELPPAAAAPPAPAAAPPAPPYVQSVPAAQVTTSLKWPSRIAFANSDKLAFESLFKAYGIKMNRQISASPCDQAITQGMRCYEGHGGLSDLFRLNQPVLMRLSTPEGRDYAVVLSMLDRQTATLIAAGIEQRVMVNDLANSWFGQYVALWHMPPDYKGNISPGGRGRDVIWLRNAMETIDGIRSNGSDVYDAELARRIRAFQLSDGIEPNGIVDPETIIRLNVKNGRVRPRLVTEKSG